MPSIQRAGIANHASASACLILHATATGTGVHLFTSSLRLSCQSPSARTSPASAQALGSLANRTSRMDHAKPPPLLRNQLRARTRRHSHYPRRRIDRSRSTIWPAQPWPSRSLHSQAPQPARPCQSPTANTSNGSSMPWPPRSWSGAPTGNSSHDSPPPTHSLLDPAPRFGSDGHRTDPSARTRCRPPRRSPGKCRKHSTLGFSKRRTHRTNYAARSQRHRRLGRPCDPRSRPAQRDRRPRPRTSAPALRRLRRARNPSIP